MNLLSLVIFLHLPCELPDPPLPTQEQVCAALRYNTHIRQKYFFRGEMTPIVPSVFVDRDELQALRERLEFSQRVLGIMTSIHIYKKTDRSRQFYLRMLYNLYGPDAYYSGDW